MPRLFLCLLLGGFTSVLGAQEVTPENNLEKSAVSGALDNSYGSIEMRQTHSVKFDAQDPGRQANVTPETQVRPSIGAKWFDDKLDVNVLFKIKKEQDSDQVKESSHELWAQYDVINGKYGFFSPAIWSFLPYKGKNGGTATYVGTYQGLKLPLTTGIGKLDLKSEAYLFGIVNSRKSDATIDNQTQIADESIPTRFGLKTNDDGDVIEEDGKRDMSYNTTFNVMAKLSPTKKFSAEASTWFDQTYDPRYTLVDSDGTKEVSYTRTRYTVERLRLTYKMTDKFSLINDSYLFHAGAWEGRYNEDNSSGNPGARFQNVIRASYDLF